jgi:hypothetical protein
MPAVAVAVCVVALVVTGCVEVEDPVRQAEPTMTGAAPTTGAPRTTTSLPPASSIAEGTALALLGQLVVAPEADADTYDRDRFGGWRTVDGCTTRERVLIAESRSAAQVDPFGCRVVAGDWVSRYDGAEVTDPAELEIDHLVPLKEAWESGASTWSEDRRTAFANDVGYAESLNAVTADSNQTKGASDPSEWLPPRADAHCFYAFAWVQVKLRWDLTADATEVAALEAPLRTCPDLAALAPADPAP